MNTINITTSQNIDVEYELGSLGDRIMGRIVDFIVIIAYFLIIALFTGLMNARSEAANITIMIVISFPVLFYFLLCEIFLGGQTLGKKVMGIKVISLNGDRPTLSQYLIRWVFRLIDFSFTFQALGFIMVAVSEKKQRLGDLVAGTAVVKTTARKQLHDTIFEDVDATAYEVSYPEVINLKDADIQLIKEVLITAKKTDNPFLRLEAQRKVEQILQIKSREMEPREFLIKLLKDYNHLTSQPG